MIFKTASMNVLCYLGKLQIILHFLRKVFFGTVYRGYVNGKLLVNKRGSMMPTALSSTNIGLFINWCTSTMMIRKIPLTIV